MAPSLFLSLPPSLAPYCDVYFPSAFLPSFCVALRHSPTAWRSRDAKSSHPATEREAALRAAAAATAMVTFYALQNNM